MIACFSCKTIKLPEACRVCNMWRIIRVIFSGLGDGHWWLPQAAKVSAGGRGHARVPYQTAPGGLFEDSAKV